MTAPALSRRGVRPVVRVRPSAAFLGVLARGECLCALIDAADRPCLTCAAQQAIEDRAAERAPVPWWRDVTPVERFAVVVAAVLWLTVVAVLVFYPWGAS